MKRPVDDALKQMHSQIVTVSIRRPILGWVDASVHFRTQEEIERMALFLDARVRDGLITDFRIEEIREALTGQQWAVDAFGDKIGHLYTPTVKTSQRRPGEVRLRHRNGRTRVRGDAFLSRLPSFRESTFKGKGVG